MVAIEALAQGLAIFASRIGGVMDVVEDGVNGGLAELTPESFAGAMRPALSDGARLAELRAGSLDLVDRFDLARSVAAYEAVLRRNAHGLSQRDLSA
jgi:UDP-glucose:(heptosyl)LPS alpha-1,3-glucosyltransferase